MQVIGQYCNHLQSVNLGWCENVSVVGVMSLAYGCPDLRSLDLCGCVLITGTSLDELIRGGFCLVEYNTCVIYDVFLEALSLKFEALVYYRCQLVESLLFHGLQRGVLFASNILHLLLLLIL